MKNQITILFAGGLLAANAVMAAPATAQTRATSDGGSNQIAILQGRGSANGIDPQSAKAYFDRGNAKYRSGDLKGAIADFDSAIRINPQYATAYSSRGNAKSDLGDKNAAIADYDIAIRINPQYAIAYSNRGLAKSGLGDKNGAIADYDIAIRINPQFANAYSNRGNAKSALGDKNGAIADYDIAIRINPQFAIAYSNRGVAKSSLGDKNGAIADYDIAIRINPQFANAYSNRGVTKSDLGDKNGAIADWTKASELYRQQGQMDSYQAMITRINKVNTLAISDEGLKQGWTSISQLKDIQPSDSYYQAVESLTERWGVIYAYNDNKFHGERLLTRGQLISFLNSSLDRMNEIMAAANADGKSAPAKIGYCSDKPLAVDEVFCRGYSLYKNNVTSVSQIKDVISANTYFANLQSLTERYDIKIIDVDNYFRASKSVTKKELYMLMDVIFNYRPVGPQIVSEEPVSRGEFIKLLDEVLSYANERTAQATSRPLK